MIADIFVNSIKSLWSNKMRSFLTLLGIVIGIYTVVTLLATAEGLQKQISDQVEGLGPRTIIILPGESDSSSGGPNIAVQLAPSTLRSTDITLLKQQADLIEPDTIDYATILGGVLHSGTNKVTVMPLGATPGIADALGLKKISQGRAMTDADIAKKTRAMFIAQSAADKLAVKVGDTVMLGKDSFTIQGIYENPDTSSLAPDNAQNPALMPISVAQEISGSDTINRIVAKAKDVNKVDAAKAQITSVLSAAHGTADFTVLLSSDLLKSVTKITDILKYAVVGIAAISLLVGGIGISNIMLVTVTERTREIGIRKAVGATEGAILLQFLIESVLLTLIGAAIGLGLATATSIVAAKFSPLRPEISSGTVLLALAMGALTGVIFGLFPAYRAARKNPVEALRFE